MARRIRVPQTATEGGVACAALLTNTYRRLADDPAGPIMSQTACMDTANRAVAFSAGDTEFQG